MLWVDGWVDVVVVVMVVAGSKKCSTSNQGCGKVLLDLWNMWEHMVNVEVICSMNNSERART